MKQGSMTLAGVILMVLSSANTGLSQETKIPPGCVASPEVTMTESGWCDRVIHRQTGIELIFIPGGTFAMGSRSPMPYEVTVLPFYMGKTEVTNAQYRKFLEAGGYDGKADSDKHYDLYLRHFRGESMMSADDDYPIVWVSWHNAKAFCTWADLTLPSEAQWEFACRAGTTTRYFFGDMSKFAEYGWALHNSNGFTHPVAQKKPNAWGLYDMLGNVWEWAEDDFAFDLLPHPQIARPTDGSARMEGGLTKSSRGGSWSSALGIYFDNNARNNSAAVNAFNNVGFRVLLPLK